MGGVHERRTELVLESVAVAVKFSGWEGSSVYQTQCKYLPNIYASAQRRHALSSDSVFLILILMMGRDQPRCRYVGNSFHNINNAKQCKTRM